VILEDERHAQILRPDSSRLPDERFFCLSGSKGNLRNRRSPEDGRHETVQAPENKQRKTSSGKQVRSSRP
jgi:hypothetical protein